jgi:protoporphyrinogen/coproporphyrinogen III oxidase
VKQPREERHVYTPVNGMSTLIDELAKPIKQVHLNTAVDSISRQKDVWLVDTGTERFEARTLVLATGAEATAGLIRGLNSGLADELSAIPHSGVQVLHCSYDRSQGSPLNAFGALWADHGPVRGVMDQSVILGLEGSTQYMAVYSEPDAIEQEILNEVRKVLSLTGRINIDHQVLWNRAIPQYVVGHQKIIDDVDILEHQHPGLHLIGSFRGGVSIADRVRQGAGTA